MTTAALQRELQREVTHVFDMGSDEVLRKVIASVKRTVSRALASKERDFDAETWEAIRQARKEFAEGKCIELKTKEDIENFFKQIEAEANVSD